MAKRSKPVGSGRKAHVPPLKRYCILLTEEQAKLLRMWGRGDLTAGLRWLIETAALVVHRPTDPAQSDHLHSG